MLLKGVCIKKSLLMLFIMAITETLIAQHENHMSGDNKISEQDTSGKRSMMAHENFGNMSHAFSLNLPMSRNGSGTGWLADESPMYGVMFHTQNWMYMLHGNLFLRYNNQDFTGKGTRGDQKFDAPNWLMFMGQRKVGANGL